MNGIYGLVNLDGSPVSAEETAAMGSVLRGGRDAHFDGVPGDGLRFAASGRIDNREELFDRLELPGDRDGVSDDVLIRHAYARWKHDAPRQLLGDWSFAAWEPAPQTLCLARDHYGNTALYYSVTGSHLAFASDRRALLALPWVDRSLDELYLAHTMVAWPEPGGEGTVYTGVRRVPPAHYLALRQGKLTLHRYWRAEDTPQTELADPRAYVDGLRHHLTQAVDVRLRTTQRIAIALSGGIDSAAVAALASPRLAQRGASLVAFTATATDDASLADDVDHGGATALARHFRNIEHHRVTAANVSPIDGVERFLAIHGEPGRAVANHYWLTALLEQARDSGCGVLLTGQAGNATISWTGGTGLKPALDTVRQGAVREGLAQIVVAAATMGRNQFRRVAAPADQPWRRYSSIAPRFAARMKLVERMRAAGWDAGYTRTISPRAQRLRLIRPVADTVGATWAQLGRAYGVEMRDPTHDTRLIEFTLSIPDRHWRGAIDRHLIREATRGLIPDVVRLQMRRGRQAADLVPRLLRCGPELDAWLAALDRSDRVREYVDVDYLKQVRGQLGDRPSPRVTNQAATVLLRGLCCGLFLLRLQ